MGLPPENEIDELLQRALGALYFVDFLIELGEGEQAALGQAGALQDLLHGDKGVALFDEASIGAFDGPRQDLGFML
ncbi:hypothetical protein D3C85_1644540 [compost metagenome]